MAILGVGEEPVAGWAIETGRSWCSGLRCRLLCWLDTAASVLGPVTNEQLRVKLEVGRTILQVSVSVGAEIEGMTVLGVGEEAVTGRTVKARRRKTSSRWLCGDRLARGGGGLL